MKETQHGVILAGGLGTRLGTPYNKHMALVYDRPMIEYPAETLQALGAEYGHVVTSAQGVGEFLKAYEFDIAGLPVEYHIQQMPSGPAAAIGETALKGTFPVLCGDVYFDPPPEPSERATLYWHEFEGAQNHSVWDPETNEIIEKPLRDIGKRAIVAYYYDERVYDFITQIEPTERGELELVDLHRLYLQDGVEMVEYKGFFGDMGTPDGLLRVANHVQQK